MIRSKNKTSQIFFGIFQTLGKFPNLTVGKQMILDFFKKMEIWSRITELSKQMKKYTVSRSKKNKTVKYIKTFFRKPLNLIEVNIQ
jgi:hypothetical protein